MNKLMLVAGLTAATLVPSFAFAQPTCGQQRDQQVGATLAGAGVGALLGDSIAPRGDRAAGAVIGGVSGAVVGNQLARPDRDCAHAYGYYDGDNQWHANAIARADARGYYDRDGAWVDGAPNGYYDGGGHWVAAARDVPARGYYDARDRWIPASASGYYDDGGQWVASVSGHYDDGGRWIAGPSTGAYDVNGHWMAGARSGHADANGVWIADAQPGYYDTDHRWRAGATHGYYDAQGVWIGLAPSAAAYGQNASFEGAAQRHDVDSRLAWLRQRIQTATADGALSPHDAARDLRRLDSIGSEESDMLDDDSGQLSAPDEASLQGRLDRLSTVLRASLAAGS